MTVLGKHQDMNDHTQSEQMHQSLSSRRNSKKKKLGRNRSGMFRTNAPDVVVTEQQQNRKNQGCTVHVRPKQEQKSLLSRLNGKRKLKRINRSGTF